jgi:intracellular sulfur oxidation DsrE/DsrF family protein
MSREQEFSDEFLSAFVDDQLAVEDKDRAYARMNQDPALNRGVCELRTIRELVQRAYTTPPTPTKNLHVGGVSEKARWKLSGAVAAGLLLVFGLVLGWLIQQPFAEKPLQLVHRPSNQTTGLGATKGAGTEQVKVLFHLNSGDPVRMKETLDDAEDLLKYYRAGNQHAQIEIITNGSGLDLLRTDISPYPERVQRMLKDYDNLVFVACQNTMDRVSHEQSVTARLLPGVVVIDSGVAQIMRRQQQGWAYIRS